MLQREPGVRSEDVWRSAKRADPLLTSRLATLKIRLTNKLKAERLAFARKWADISVDDLMRIVFIDESKIGLSPRARRVLCRRGEEVILVDRRAGRTSLTSRPVEYILAVNGYVGIVHLSIVSDKQRYKPGQAVHQVSPVSMQ